MDDARVWEFESGLWKADREDYARGVDEACVMRLPSATQLVQGGAAIDAVAATPRWDQVDLSDQIVTRPQEGLIVVGYVVDARLGETEYRAACTSTYRRRGHDDWTVVQHHQTPLEGQHEA